MRKNKTQGFIALFSVIIISFTLLILTISLSFSSLLARYNIFDSEVKETSTETADACIEVARLAIATENYILDQVEDITVDLDSGNTCKYKITDLDSVEICSEVNASYTFYKVDFDNNLDTLPIDNFTEEGPEPVDLSTGGTCHFQ